MSDLLTPETLQDTHQNRIRWAHSASLVGGTFCHMGFAHTASGIDSLQSVVASFEKYRNGVLDIGEVLGTDFDVQGLSQQVDDVITGKSEFPDELPDGLPVSASQAKRLPKNYTDYLHKDFQRTELFQSVVNDPTAKFDFSLYNLLWNAYFLSRSVVGAETPEAFGRTIQGDRVNYSSPDREKDITMRLHANPFEMGYMVTAFYVSAMRALIESGSENAVLDVDMSDRVLKLTASIGDEAKQFGQNVFHDLNGFDPNLLERVETKYDLGISGEVNDYSAFLQVQFPVVE